MHFSRVESLEEPRSQGGWEHIDGRTNRCPTWDVTQHPGPHAHLLPIWLKVKDPLAAHWKRLEDHHSSLFGLASIPPEFHPVQKLRLTHRGLLPPSSRPSPLTHSLASAQSLGDTREPDASFRGRAFVSWFSGQRLFAFPMSMVSPSTST